MKRCRWIALVLVVVLALAGGPAAAQDRVSIGYLVGSSAAPVKIIQELGLARKRKRERRCKKVDQPERIPTCEEHCFPDFPLCYTRTDGPPLCANGAFENGETPCSSDQDCLTDPSRPYCLVSATTQATGATNRFTTCEPYAKGCCIYAGIFP